MELKFVKQHIQISSSAERILEAFVRIEDLSKWWGVEKCNIELKKGGLYILLWGVSENGVKYTSTGIVESFISDRILHIRDAAYISTDRPILGPVEMILKVESIEENSSKLFVEQGPYPQINKHWNWYYESVEEGWKNVLPNLKKYLEV